MRERERERERWRKKKKAPEREIFAAKKNKNAAFPAGHAEFLYTYLPVTVCPVDGVGKTAARRPISFLGNYLNKGRYLVDIYLPTYLSLCLFTKSFLHFITTAARGSPLRLELRLP